MRKVERHLILLLNKVLADQILIQAGSETINHRSGSDKTWKDIFYGPFLLQFLV